MTKKKTGTKTKTTDHRGEPVFNTFTKSYPTRHIVHGARTGDVKTLCGRDIVQLSDETFDVGVEGSCLKCRQSIDVETRIHPGWVGK